MTLTVSGVDMNRYIAVEGLEYQLSDVDGPKAGRTMDALMQRAKIASKEKFTIKCRDLTTAEMSVVLGAVDSEYVEATYLSPRYNSVITGQMYVGDRKASHRIKKGATDYWSGLSFSLTER